MVRLLFGCFEEVFCLVLSGAVFDIAFPPPFKVLPLPRFESDEALSFAIAPELFAIDRGGGVALRIGLLGHIKREW